MGLLGFFLCVNGFSIQICWVCWDFSWVLNFSNFLFEFYGSTRFVFSMYY